MKQVLQLLIAIAIVSSAGAQEPRLKGGAKPPGRASGYASRDATVLSVMGWGVGLAVGIATLFALLDNNKTSSSDNGHSH
jgi:hypothetical protein